MTYIIAQDLTHAVDTAIQTSLKTCRTSTKSSVRCRGLVVRQQVLGGLSKDIEGKIPTQFYQYAYSASYSIRYQI